MYRKKFKPSKIAKREFAKKMDEIRKFCDDNLISYSNSMDSFYFTIKGKHYRVSNHTIESSNAGAFDNLGQQIRELYHETKRNDEVTYIHASKIRIIEIYNDLVAGYELNGKGYRK